MTKCPECGGRIAIRKANEQRVCREDDCDWSGEPWEMLSNEGYTFSGVL